MTRQLGARTDGQQQAVSTAPSFNKTPVGSATPPLPYPTVARLDNAQATVGSVRLNGRPVLVLDQSKQPTCTGDGPGVAKGVRSGTVNGEVKPVQGSNTVRAGKHGVIRMGDPCTMQGGNNPGIYVRVPAVAGTAHAATGSQGVVVQAETEAERTFLERARHALESAARNYKDRGSESLHGFADHAMAVGGDTALAGGATAAVGAGLSATGIGAPVGVPMAAVGAATTAVGTGVTAVGGAVGAGATALDVAADLALTGNASQLGPLVLGYAKEVALQRVERLLRKVPGADKVLGAVQDGGKGAQGKKPQKDEGKGADKTVQAGGGGTAGNVHVVGSGGGGDCGIKPYKDQKCPEGQQAHHIVPDYALRYGSRGKGAKGQDRIPGMPSLQDGPSICLTGQAKTQGSEHNAAHEGTDPRINALGERADNGGKGLAPIGEILNIAVDEVAKFKPHCADEIKRKTEEAFKDVDRSKYGRTTQQPPKKGTEAHGALERGDQHGSTPNRRRR